MESKIKDLRQQLFNFEFNKSFNSNDFFVSESNFYAYNLLLSWPNWEKKIINIHGERYSGKTHLIEIFLEKNKGLIIDINKLKNYDLEKLRFNQNIIIDNISEKLDESLFYSLIDTIDKYNKFLILTSNKSINDLNIKLKEQLFYNGLSIPNLKKKVRRKSLPIFFRIQTKQPYKLKIKK